MKKLKKKAVKKSKAATPAAPSGPVGGGGRLFADPVPGADETTFQVDNTSQAYYNSPYYKLHQDQLQPIPTPAAAQPGINLADVVSAALIADIQAANRIVFHSVGDTGAAKVTPTAAAAIASEAHVADAMAADVTNGGTSGPAFFFHLGDVIYYFGEGQYYYDQFYEPFRGYDRPIFAIPGNHDGMVFGPGTEVPQVPTLQAYLRNFCAPAPGPSPDSGGLVRSVMTQPGVYFTLDAPFVSIIGLYSNVLEGPGVISSQGGQYPISDEQLGFLQAELTRLQPAHDAGERAVLLAVHHPPASVDSVHGGTVGLANDIDATCKAAGFWPDAVLSGHAHLYQRFSRSVAGLSRSIPYIVSGSGGFAATAPQSPTPAAGTTIGNYTLVTPPIVQFGYLTITVDMTGSAGALTISYKSVTSPSKKDSVTVVLPPKAGAAAAPKTAKTTGRKRR
jgi:calcineurin-like phosphoesterase family protein